MTDANQFPALYTGLDQIPTAGLKRLKKALEDKKSELIFGGAIIDSYGYY